MNGIAKVIKFHLSTLFKQQSYALFGVLLLNVLISVVVIRVADVASSDPNAMAGSTDPVALIWMLVLGILFFPESFRFMLSHGVSRRRYFYSGMITIAAWAAVWACLVTLVAGVANTFTSIIVVFDLLYPGYGVGTMLLWEFGALFLFTVIGWFSFQIFYVSGRKTRLVLIAAPFVVGPLLLLFNILTDGAVFSGIVQFFLNILGLGGDTPNPYISTLSLIVVGLVLGGGLFLMLRRAQIKEG